MRANCWMGRTTVEVREVPDPKILNARDAIVRISSTAICGSDLHLYNGYIPTMKKGDILGHEFMGEVVEVGPAVSKVKVGPIVIEDDLPDEQVLFLSDILPTGYMGAELADITPGDVVAVWGAGPVGLLAMASARLLGAGRVIAIDRFPYRLERAAEHTGAETINYEETDVAEALQWLTAGRGPDACIDAVGMEAHQSNRALHAYDRTKQAARLESDRPHALREAILSCRNGGTVSVIGVYGGFVDKFPMGSVMNRSLTIRAGQCHVQRYLRPLLDRIRNGEIDSSFVISHQLPLDQAPQGFEMFKNKEDNCTKIVLKP
jgi:threonine dehydrogenase-like Zn-dependent dehydrogenase